MADTSILLKKTQEARLSELYQTKCDEVGRMDFTQFILFAIERNMIKNKFGIEIFYTAFKEACGEDFNHQINHGVLDNTKFYYAIILLSKVLYGNEPAPFEAMFSNMLVDKIMKSDHGLIAGRLPKQDAETMIAIVEIFSLDAVKVNLAYLEQLKRLFTDFIHVNLNVGKKTVSWRDIEDRNISMIARSFLKLCRYNYLIPHLFNIEALHNFVEQTLPPITNGEYEFYDKQKLCEAFNEDKNYQTTMVEPMVDEKGELMEPELHFHEFLFLLGLIAKNCITAKDDSIQTKLQDFYIQKLNFKKVPNAKDADLNYEDVLNKMYNEDYKDDKAAEGEYDEECDYDYDSEEEAGMGNNREIQELIERQAAQERTVNINWEQLMGSLEAELPMIPQKPVVEQINPPPYAMPVMWFGKHKPKDEDDDKKKKGKKKAKSGKDGPAPKVIKWEEGPRKEFPYMVDHVKQQREGLVENTFPISIKGAQGNPGIAPVIIKEVYFPPESPSEVATLIESGLVYQNSAQYEMAIECFNNARLTWLDLIKNDEKVLKKEQDLYLELSIASVYESAGKDDLALNSYNIAKSIKLPYNHPDQAFAFCGLGSVFYHMEEPAWALRFYLQARTIREETLGGDTVDTATVYNNLGCCMFMLERNEEAKAYFELAEAILECELGPQHERTLTARKNIDKIKKTDLGIVPVYRPLWRTAFPKPHPSSKKKKKKKKGKKK